MRLTEGNRDKIWMTRSGTFNYKSTSYIYGGLCKKCGDPFLVRKRCLTSFCSLSCSHSGENNHMFGKKHTEKTIEKMSKANSGENGFWFGKKHSAEHRQKISIAHSGENSCRYQRGAVELGIPLYDKFGFKLDAFEDVRIYLVRVGCTVYKALQVRCNNSECEEWFVPTRIQVQNRLRAANSIKYGSHNFYCSEGCKTGCPTFGQVLYYKGQNDIIRTYTTEELKTWSREVLRRNNFICACCGEPATIGHHKKSKIEFPEFALDPNNGIALCKLCHMPIFHKGSNHPSHYIDKCR